MTESEVAYSDPAEDATAVPVAPVTRARRRGLTPRQAFGLLAGVLGLALIGLVVYLLYVLSPTSFTLEGGKSAAGIKPVLTITGPGKGEQPRFNRPMGVAYGKEGRIYVADTGNNRVCVFDSEGKFLFEFGGFGVGKPLPGVKATWKEGLLNFPVGIDTDEQGNVYVADFRNDQVQVFDSEGKFLRVFPDRLKRAGKGGSGQDGTGIAVTDVSARYGKVYATDAYQVFVFNTAGKLLRQFGKPGGGKADLDHPNGVTVGEDGTIYVSDSNHNRVSAFDPEGELLWTVGEPTGMQTPSSLPTSTGEAMPGEAAEDGKLGLPRGLTVTEDGSLMVVDAFDFQLVHIDENGKVLGRYGERGVDPGQVNFPNDVDALRDRLLIADKENNRVEVVELIETPRP